MECDFCDDYEICSNTPCPYHPLKTDRVKELHDALNDGNGLWGDMGYDEEVSRLASRTEADIKLDIAKSTNDEKLRQNKLKTEILDKTRRQHCVVVKGVYVLMHKMQKKCVNSSLPGVVLPDGSIYPGGCWAQQQAICPFMHPGEEKKYTFIKGAPIYLVPASPTPSSPPTLYRPRTASNTSSAWSPRAVTPCKEMTL